MLIAVVLIAVVNTAMILLLGSALGLFVLIPMGLVAVPVLMFLCQMTPRNALIAAGAMMAARLVLMWVF